MAWSMEADKTIPDAQADQRALVLTSVWTAPDPGPLWCER